MAPADESYLNRVFAAATTEESRKLYDEWATTYDSDMASHSFTAPRLVAEAIAKNLKLGPDSPSYAQLLDAGCGSGAVGLSLSHLGFKYVDGLDISQGMLNVAETTGAYRKLQIADLNKTLDASDGSYDAVTCCGTFTHGHLGPEPMTEFVRVIKSGGVLAATVLESHWVEKGFERKVEQMVSEGLVELIEKDVHAYRKDAGGGRVLVLKKL